MKIKNFIILLFPIALTAQIPAEYSVEQLDAIRRVVQQLERDNDIVIDPIERLPVQPTDYSVRAQGNWGAIWTGSKEHYADVYDRAQRPIAVFIFDTAPVFTHPALTGFTWNERGKSYTGEPTLQDGQGHGTHVAGIIGGRDDDYDIGIARALVDKGLLMGIPREVLTDEGTGSFSWTAKAVEEAVPEAIELMDQGWFVVFNLSLGGPGTHGATDRALKAAKAAGIFTCVAAGNTYGEGLEFPARSEGVYAIGSIDPDGRRSSFSTYGDGLFIAAPGRNILSTWKNDRLVELSGTSMATPTQAALVAITASVHPELSAGEIEKLLIDVATDIDPAGYDIETGHGYDYVGKILSYQSDEPEDPDPEQPDDPESQSKGRRTVRAILPGPYQAVYQAGGGLFVDIEICDIVLDFKSHAYSEDALTGIKTAVGSFFENRAVTLTDKGDALRAGYWLGRFLELYMKESGVKADFITACVKDVNGNIGKPEWPTFWDLFNKSRRTTFRY